MRDKPDITEGQIAACLCDDYGIAAVSVRFLPIGHDANASVFEALTAGGEAYFVKVRADGVPPASLIVPRVLIEYGIPNILAPLRSRSGALWSALNRYSLIVTPFIRGENAKVAGLSDSQWREFGATLRAIHAGGFAALMEEQVPRETFSLPSARLVRRIAAQIPGARFDSRAATCLAAFWGENAPFIEQVVARAEALGKRLQQMPFEFVLCHADIHAANILVSPEGRIYLIDWDGPLLAPRERDLLFVVGGRIARPVLPPEETLFFEGYGKADIEGTALAYYRYERAIEDIGEFGRSVFWKRELSEATREEETGLFIGLFGPGSILEAAMDADREQS